jgi:hypothetical protein
MQGTARQRLLARLLDAAGVTSTGLLFAAACGASTTHDGPALSGAGGGGNSGNPSGGATSTAGTITIGPVAGSGSTEPVPQPETWCLPALEASGGAPAVEVTGGGGGLAGESSSSGTGGLGSAGELNPAESSGGSSGIGVPCLKREEAAIQIAGMDAVCDLTVHAVNSGPRLENGQCCYEVLTTSSGCYVGRAFLVEDGFLKSTVRRGGDWSYGPSPSVNELDQKTRHALAEAWVKDGLFEHASVATFARFAIQLLSVGAPARLLYETLAAGRDEIRHAELCFALASAYAGEPLEADCFPIGNELHIDRSLAEIVTETVVEGCIGETLAAMQAAAQLELASDPAVVAALASTIEDESRHAELAWRVVAWAVRSGGPEVRAAAARAFAGFRPPSPPRIDLEGVSLQSFAAHGRLTPEHARAVALDALDNVVRPCAAALLERHAMSESVTYA